jgi:hypothetical protein
VVGREVKKNVEEWSFVSQGDHWIDPGGAARGDVAWRQTLNIQPALKDSVTDDNINRSDHDGAPPLAEQTPFNEKRIPRRNASQTAARGLVQRPLWYVVAGGCQMAAARFKKKCRWGVMHRTVATDSRLQKPPRINGFRQPESR